MDNIRKAQESAQARFSKEGDKGTKYYFSLNKDKMEKQIILGLMDKNNRVHTDMRIMTEIASQYHANLQKAQEASPE